MNFAFSEEQEELRKVVRQFLDSKSSEADVREQMDTEQGYDPEAVGAAAERLEAPWPPEQMAAKFSFSLGDLYPADFNDGVLPNPAAGRAPANRLP